MNDLPRPVLGQRVYIAPTSFVAGEVTLGDECTIMHHVVIRADIAPIRLGNRVNVQDGSVLHIKNGVPLDIEDDVGIGHRAVVHCRRVRSRSLIGTGSIVLDDAEVGCRCLVAAGTLVPPGMIVPDDSVVMGTPGRVLRRTTEADLAVIDHVVTNYVRLGRLYAEGRFPPTPGTH